MMLRCKSVYDKPLPNDGERVYVDRLWPEGITTRDAAISRWLQEIAPSYELWRHNYDLDNWEDYRQKYWDELSEKDKKEYFIELKKIAEKSNVTLIYGTSNPQKNNAVVIKEFLEAGRVAKN